MSCAPYRSSSRSILTRFDDGNGRCSRLLAVLLLYHHGYDVGRYISLERVFEQTRKSYCDTLERCSQGWRKREHDALPWMNYFWCVLLDAYREFEDHVGAIRAGKGAKAERIRNAVERKLGPFRTADIKVECSGVSHEWVRRILRELRDEGVIEFHGHGPGVHWVKKLLREAAGSTGKESHETPNQKLWRQDR